MARDDCVQRIIESVDIAGQPDLIHRQYRARARRYSACCVLGIEIVSARVDIGNPEDCLAKIQSNRVVGWALLLGAIGARRLAGA